MPRAEAERFFRAERRAKLRQTGEFLKKTKPTASKRVPPSRLSPTTKAAFSNIARQAGLGPQQTFMTFAVQNAPRANGRGAKTAAAPSRYHVALGTLGSETIEKVKHGVAAVAKELNGRIVGYRVYYQK